MYEIYWVVDYLDDLKVDFLVLYRIEDPWSLPGPEFFKLATRTFYYPGTMQARATMEAQEDEDQNPSQNRYSEPEINHNTAAAKQAGKGLKEGDREVTYVPLSVLMKTAGSDGAYATASGS